MKKKVLTIFYLVNSLILAMESIENVKLGTTTISAEGFEENIRNTPKTVYIVLGEEIKKSGAQTIPEALKIIPGVKSGEGEDGSGIIDIRGQGKQYDRNTAILIDGVKMNPIEMTKFDFSTISIDSIEKIEIIPGNASVLYGDNTVGGAINIITKNGNFAEYVNIRGEASSYNTLKYGTDFSTNLDDLNIFGRYNKKTSNGYRENQRYNIENIELGSKYKVTKNSDLLIKYDYLNGYKRNPGKLTEAQLEEDRRQASTPKDWTKNESNRFTGAYRYFTDNFELINQSSYYKNHYYSNSLTFDGKLTEDFANNFKVKYLLGKNKIVFGLDYLNGKTEIKHKKTWAKKEGYGVFLIDTYNFTEKFSLQSGYRRQETEFTYSIPEKKKDFSINVYDVSLNYKYSDTGSIYLSLGKDFRTPLTNELLASNGYLNKDIKPQVGYNIEVGGSDYVRDIFITSALFYKKIKDEIYLDVSNKAGGSWGTNTNYDGKTEKIGYELMLEKDITNTLSITGSYSYLYPKFVSGEYEGKEIPGVSKNKVGVQLNYSPIEKINSNLIFNYFGSSYALSDEYNKERKVESYITLDLNINYAPVNYLTLYMGIKNLTDEKYNERVQEVKGIRSYYPAMGRRYYAGFEYKLY
ncbi:TonB-dependent receptor [Cetobacterium sp.]|uniref:TonB-dependent receptor n=1 Tax=Cetobacterium sp. TaxID=2071632 RepID=UPI002FC722CF